MLKISRNSNVIKIYRNVTSSTQLRSNRKGFCTNNQKTDGEKQTKSKVNFDTIVSQRHEEAKRSVLVQVSSGKSFNELQKYCLQFGNISSAHHYSVKEDNSHFILIEYQTIEETDNCLNNCVFNQEQKGVPTKSQFLWFRTGPKIKATEINRSQCQLNVVDGKVQVTDDELNIYLKSAENLVDQIQIVYNSTKLSDLGIRMRFLAARQLQNSLSGMFPTASAHPFGSSVNGFGKEGCDLDMILRLEADVPIERESRLVFHTKPNLNNGRTQAQRFMEGISDILQLFLPGVNNVRRILQARVPIVKYNHEYLDLEVDLSMNNMTGVYMSELLYMFGQIDDRVRPLTFCIRRWAKCVGLTNFTPGYWISNFSLTLLIMYFLQQLKQPILPAINLLTHKARKQDERITEDGIDCTFLRDLNALEFITKNTTPIDELLRQFFEFYSSFDFNKRGITLNEGKTILKPDHSAMYIVNPLEKALNVSRNVSFEETERFRIEVRNAAWILESDSQANRKKNEPCGLLNLFKTNQKSLIRPQMFFKPRMVELTDLFEENETDNTQRISYKNNSVKNQVAEIKNMTKKELNKVSRRMEGVSAKSTRRR